jgi:VWFA-related protein
MRYTNNILKLRTTIVPVLLLAFIAFSQIANAQEDVIRVDTNLVTIPATVLDRDGRYVPNLQKEDFQIFEDGVEQEIAYFEPTVEPFSVLFLLDNSGSMTNHLASLARAASAFVKQMRPDDQLIVAIFSGGGKIKVILEATRKRNFKQQILLRPLGGNPTTTFDAVKLGIKYMKKFQGRRAIILFSDGELYGQNASAKSNLRDAEEQESLIYTIRFGAIPPGYRPDKKDRWERLIEEANNYLQGLAQKTGGRSYQIDDIANLEETFRTIAEELGQQYSLGYYPQKQPETGQRRQIKVKMRQSNLVVRARDGYIFEPGRGTKQQ